MKDFDYKGERRQTLELPVPSELKLTVSYDQASRRFVAYLGKAVRKNIDEAVSMAVVPHGSVPCIDGGWLHMGGAGFPVVAPAAELLTEWLTELRRLSLQTASPDPALCRALGGAK